MLLVNLPRGFFSTLSLSLSLYHIHIDVYIVSLICVNFSSFHYRCVNSSIFLFFFYFDDSPRQKKYTHTHAQNFQAYLYLLFFSQGKMTDKIDEHTRIKNPRKWIGFQYQNKTDDRRFL